MDPSRIGMFALAERRLAWLDQRQAVLAQNIANADSPGYAARDLVPFGTHLAHMLAPARTSPAHLAASGGSGERARAGRVAVERAPDGNAVQLEDQLLKVADTDAAQLLVTGLVRKYATLVRTALGRS